SALDDATQRELSLLAANRLAVRQENEQFWNGMFRQALSMPAPTASPVAVPSSTAPTESPSAGGSSTSAPNTSSPTAQTTDGGTATDVPTSFTTTTTTILSTTDTFAPTGSGTGTFTPTASGTTRVPTSDGGLEDIIGWEDSNSTVSGGMVDISDDGRRMVVAVNDSYVNVYEDRQKLGSDIPVPPLEEGDTFIVIRSIAISGSGDKVAMATQSGRISLEGDTSPRKGKVQVFEYDGTDWIKLGSTLEGAPNDEFEYSVSLSFDGDRVAAGAPFAPDRRGAGYVRVFEYSDDDWLQLGQTLTGPDDLGSGFGASLELTGDGSMIVIGMPYASSGGLDDSGRVQVYSFSTTSNVWSQVGQVLAIPVENAQFGIKVVIDESEADNVLTIGVASISTTDKRGQVRMYRSEDGQGWNQLGAVINGIPPANLFGADMDLRRDGSVVAIGDASDSYITVQQWNGAEWAIVGTIIRGAQINFGSSVAISENLVVAGTEQDRITMAFSTSLFEAVIG
ncbi:MAG: hypothetical protein SGILL_006587, partial [Bacillariaceae sp.]